MQMRIAVIFSLALAGWVGCTPPKQLPPAAPPSVESFTASKTEIAIGDSVTLTFKTKEATQAVIFDDLGNEITSKASDEPSSIEGSVDVSPTATRFYVLRVVGKGGTAADFVQVAVGEPLRDVALLAIPAQIRGGEETQLLWTARNALHASIRSTNGEEMPLEGLERGSGVMFVQPSRTTGYSLVADGPGHPEGVTSTTHVFVSPVLTSFQVTPQAVEKGKQLTLSFQAPGATEVTIREATFGVLPGMPLANPNGSQSNTLTWDVPNERPSGQPVLNGMPLVFTLTYKSVSPPVQAEQEAYAVVGGGPAIVDFAGPSYVSTGHSITLSWKTVNATGLEIQRDGQTVVEFFGTDIARIARGNYTFPALGGTTPATFTVVAHNVKGLSTSRSVTVTPVPLPTVSSLTVSPLVVSNLGEPLTASWTTQNASRVELLLPGAPAMRTVVGPQVARGEHTFRPGMTGELVVRAFNQAGDFVDSRVPYTVDAATGISFSHPIMLARTQATLQYQVSSVAVEQMYGAPTRVPTPILVSATEFDSLFEDISIASSYPLARTLNFEDAFDGVTTVVPGDGFRFPLLETSYERFYVGVDGVVVLEPGFLKMGNNVKIEDSVASEKLPSLIAPFWDDLRLGEESSVKYYLQGSQFPRKLIIQWTKVEMANSTSDKLTFQVQLSETGEMLFLYKALEGQGLVHGQDATVGYYLSGGRLVGVDPAADFQPKPNVADGEGMRWFATESSTLDAMTFLATRSGQLNLTAQLAGSGEYVHVRLPLQVVKADALQLSEAMPNPADFENNAGFWLELHNTTHTPIPLRGLKLKSKGALQPLPLTSTKVLAPDEYYVLGYSKNQSSNGGVAVDELITPEDLPIDKASDTLQLLLPGNQVLSSLGWLKVQEEGHSVQGPDMQTILVGGTKDQCASQNMFNDVTKAYGTPGAANTSCFPDYTMSRIEPAFEDVSRRGTPIFPVGDWDDEAVLVPLTGTLVPLYGEPEEAIVVAANGAIAVPTSTMLKPGSGSSDLSKYTNANGSVDAPSSTTPNGTFVLYANDLWRAAPLDSNVYVDFLGDNEAGPGTEAHWVVQWNKVRFFDGTGAWADDNMNFEVKLFLSGVVEFHYGTMQSPLDQVDYADGLHGVSLLENRDGSRMLRVSSPAAGPGIQSNTAYRFTPRPKAE